MPRLASRQRVSFRHDVRGSIAITFAIVSTILAVAAGLAVDTARWMSARRVNAAAVDAAVLAGARTLQLSPDKPEAATAAAQSIYAANTSAGPSLLRDTVTFSLGENGKSIVAKGDAFIGTTLLQVAGFPELQVAGYASGDLASATIATGGAGGSNIEISVMLDVTGSMCDDGVGPCTSGTKINGLKSAAKKLVDIVVSDDQSKYSSRVALVPFSTRVRVGPDGGGGPMMTALTGMPDTWTGWVNECTEGSGSGGSETNGNWVCTKIQAAHYSNWKIMPCVSDRFYNDTMRFDATDVAPGPGAWLNAHDGSRMLSSWDSSDTLPTAYTGKTKQDPASQWNYSPWGCADVANANEVLPLTSQKTTLADRIDSLEAYGATAGALGTAWSWYMLSPNWASVFPTASKPAPYADVTAKSASGAPVLRKVAVLMTDGGYNTYRTWKEQNQQTVSDYATSVCTNMKAKGIEVFTIGFALDQLPAGERTIAAATLKACGTDVAHFYDTLSVPQLEAAFQDIALKLSSVRLTQ